MIDRRKGVGALLSANQLSGVNGLEKGFQLRRLIEAISCRRRWIFRQGFLITFFRIVFIG
jgi:hypothetical protein